jgi:hypothetical protein
LHGGQKEGNEHADNRDDNEQLNERKTVTHQTLTNHCGRLQNSGLRAENALPAS